MARIGNEIRWRRVQKNLNQTELGEKIGVSRSCVAAWESGRTEPKLGEVKTLSDFFGCTMNQLIYGDGTLECIVAEMNDTQRERLLEYAKFLIKEGK